MALGGPRLGTQKQRSLAFDASERQGDHMPQQDYLISKAFGRGHLRSNEELSNRELNTRMKQQKLVKPVAGVAGQVVPGAGSLASTMDAERKFRIGRNARKAEARQIQQHEQRKRVTAAGTGAGVAIAATGLGGLKNAVKTRSVKGPFKFGIGAGLAGGSAYIGHREGKKKAKIEEGVWNRMLTKNPGGRE
jgi:hypothetical protein